MIPGYLLKILHNTVTLLFIVRHNFLFRLFSLNIYFINAEKGLGISYSNMIYALSLNFASVLNVKRWLDKAFHMQTAYNTIDISYA